MKINNTLKLVLFIAVIAIIILIVIIKIVTENPKIEDIDLKFPDGFLIGTASSSYQVEGAWNISDKQESIWDHFAHNYPEKIADKAAADISCNSYHKYKEDIQLIKNTGFDFYRFSISWPRLLPTGDPKYISKDGLRYYHSILDELERHQITPFVTIYHWDHPQSLEKSGGWLNERMVYLFSDYARVVFKEFGDRVKFFSTINEPYIFCVEGYRKAAYAPGTNLSGSGEYHCLHNMLKAHSLAYHIYDKEFRSTQKGQIGMVFPSFYFYSALENDHKSSDIALEFQLGWMANPIFSETGDYPEIMKERIAERSLIQGYNSSRLPTLSKEWIELIKGTSDYFGLNHYSSDKVVPLPKTEISSWPNDEGLEHLYDPEWPSSQSDWLKVVPEGFGNLLRKIKDKYGNPPVYVLENGVSDENGINDDLRINYLYSYMKEMLIAIKRDGCNIKAYTIWSFLDSFEWRQGFVDRFGLVQVDFNDEDRKRTPKKSLSWIKTVLKSRQLQSPNIV